MSFLDRFRRRTVNPVHERAIELILQEDRRRAFDLLEANYGRTDAPRIFQEMERLADERSAQGPYQRFIRRADAQGNVRSVPTSVNPRFERFDYGGHFSKQVKNFGNWIFILIGIIASAFFNYWFAGPFVMLFIYSLFPSEWKLRLDAERQFYEMFPGVPMEKEHIEVYIKEHEYYFIIKSFARIAVIFSFALAFYYGMGNMLLVLATFFIGYFMLPSQMREDKPEAAFSAYLRPILGIFIAALFAWVFSSGVLFLLALAFFFYPPVELETEYKTVKGIPLPHAYSLGGAYKILFFIIMVAAAIVMYTNPTTFSWGWGLELQSALGITMGSIWLMSLFAGYSSPPQSRAYIGVIMIAITMVAYSATFPGTVGSAVFGAWWPSVESSLSTVTGPLGDAFAQMQGGWTSAFSIVANPAGYYEQEMARQQATANIKSGGTTKSIEVSDFSFQINNVPEQPLVASAILENKGEFKATNIKSALNPLMLKASTAKGSYTPHPEISYKFTTCSGVTPENEGTGISNKCVWKDPSYNGDMKLMTFTYGDGGWGDLGSCVCKDSKGVYKGDCPTGVDGCRTCSALTNTPLLGSTTCDKTAGDVISYAYAGSSMQVGFNYSFDYIVNVSLDMQLMQGSTMNDLLLKKQIRLQDVEAQYSGGPVRASIWTQKQPVRASEDTLAVISITNQGTGDGIVKSGATYVLTIPYVNGKGGIKPKINHVSNGGLTCDAVNLEDNGDAENMKCTLDNDLQKGKYAKYAFIFNYPIPAEVDKKTVLFVGNVNYHYENRQMQSLIATWIPPQ